MPVPAPTKTTMPVIKTTVLSRYYRDATPTVTSYYHDATPPTKLDDPAADVVDTDSWSPPSTPPSDSSSDTTASPPAREAPSAAALYQMPRWVTPAPPPRVEVRQVWDHNFADEAALVESLLPRFRYAAVDTEFPGTVYRPAAPAYLLTAEKRYALLKANVDALHLIQLGLTLFNPGPTAVVWQFNLREFDPARHRHAPESVAMLRGAGVDFAAAARHGARAPALGARLRRWLMRPHMARDGLVTFSGGYDVAYLIKAAFGDGYRLPCAAADLEAVAAAVTRRRRMFDVKEMARRCPGDLRGGLDCVAGKLGVARDVGHAHQAGSDSLLTAHAFLRMKERYFDDDDKLSSVAGLITEITAF